MKIKSFALSLVAATLLAGAGIAPVMAQGMHTPGIDNRQDNLRARIQQGVRSGQITQREASRLYQRQRRIAQHEVQAKSDGTVTRRERAELNRELTALRADVDRKLMNDRTARPMRN